MTRPVHPITERTWPGDMETVYESGKAYVKLLSQIGEMTGMAFQDVSETWDIDKETIEIKIGFAVEGVNHVIWLQRQSDFLDCNVLLLLNELLPFETYKIQVSYNTSSIYFINEAEKHKLEAEGVAFSEQMDFHFLLFNALKFEEPTFYAILLSLNAAVKVYTETFGQTKAFRETQQVIRQELLPCIPWEMLQEKAIDISGLITFVGDN